MAQMMLKVIKMIEFFLNFNKRKWFMKRTLLALCTLIFASSASATLIVNNEVSGSVTNDFEDLALPARKPEFWKKKTLVLF